MADFTGSIESLRQRSKRARRINRIFALGTLSVVVYSFTFVVFSYTKDFSPFEKWAIKREALKDDDLIVWKSTARPEEIFISRIQQVFETALGPEPNTLPSWLKPKGSMASKPQQLTKYDPLILKANLEPILEAYERFTHAQNELSKTRTEKTNIDKIISSFALSVGVVAVLLYLLQLTVNFMRYYARLAELYDAQADALEASDGDPELAYQFLEKFSPVNIDFGKVPTTLYEKTIDALAAAVKSRKQDA